MDDDAVRRATISRSMHVLKRVANASVQEVRAATAAVTRSQPDPTLFFPGIGLCAAEWVVSRAHIRLTHRAVTR